MLFHHTAISASVSYMYIVVQGDTMYALAFVDRRFSNFRVLVFADAES